MIVKYKYRHGECGNVGWYQAESDDVKAMLKNKTFKEGLYWIVVDTGKEFHIWSAAVNKWYKRTSRAYWF